MPRSNPGPSAYIGSTPDFRRHSPLLRQKRSWLLHLLYLTGDYTQNSLASSALGTPILALTLVREFVHGRMVANRRSCQERFFPASPCPQSPASDRNEPEQCP